LGTAFLQCEELVAKIDEGRSAALAPKLEFEQSTVESQSLFDITDFERYVVETHGARFSCFSHGALHQLMKELQRYRPLKRWPNTILSLISRGTEFEHLRALWSLLALSGRQRLPSPVSF
jgi:hypothetical protein